MPNTYFGFEENHKDCAEMQFAMKTLKLYLGLTIVDYKFTKTSKTPKKLNFKTNSMLISNKLFVKVLKR